MDLGFKGKIEEIRLAFALMNMRDKPNLGHEWPIMALEGDFTEIE